MPYRKLHENEVDTISLQLIDNLIRSQFESLAHLPISYLESGGTDNVMYRLGTDYVIRLPRIASAEKSLQKEIAWLSIIAQNLSIDVPSVREVGQATEDYPFTWAIYNWLDGESMSIDNIPDPNQLAIDLASVIIELKQSDTTGAESLHAVNRGVPLATRDAQTRENIEVLRDQIDADTAHRVWESAINAPIWDDDPVWIHGDLQDGNLLTQNGKLSAVIDWGAMAIGDPACDLQVAWNLLPTEARQTFRDALQVDEAMWLRGRGWALSCGVIALPYYEQSNPILATISRRAINAVIADYLV